MKKTVEIPLQVRVGDVGAVDSESRTVPITWTTGAAVRRVDWWTGEQWIEELSTDPKHVRMDRLNSGAPLLDSHSRDSIRGILGVVERGTAAVGGGKGTATVRFSKRAEVEPILTDVKDGIIRNVSVGYSVYKYKDVSTPEDIKARVRRMRAMDWEPSEISLCPVGADAGAGVRAESEKQPCEIEFAERSAETTSDETAGQAAPPAQERGGVGLDLLRRCSAIAWRDE